MKSPVDGPQGLSPSSPPTSYFRPPAYQFQPITGPEKSLTNYQLRRESDGKPTPDVEADNGNKGLDPRGVNMANPVAIAKSFGVAPRFIDQQRYKEPGGLPNLFLVWYA